MADEELDLERGDASRTDALLAQEKGQERSRTRRSSGGSSKTVGNSGATRRRSTTESRTDDVLRTRLLRAFDRLSEWRIKKGDDELGEALAEDKEQMADGLVSLTKTIKFLRAPLLLVLAFIEPVLAFGRVGSILVGRWYEWQTTRRVPEPTQAPDTPSAGQFATEGSL